METKYKVVCPACQTKTITYDIRHLIISLTEQDEDLYVTSKYLTKKPEVKPHSSIPKQNNPFFEADRLYQTGAQSQPQSKRNSIQSIAGSVEVQTKCR